VLVDGRGLGAGELEAIAAAASPAWRLLIVGVDCPAERAALLTLGCAEVVATDVGLPELAVRAHRVDATFGMLPRWRTVGPLTLDLFHRDVRRGARWLALHPREFELLWRLADAPGQRVTRRQLWRDVWRLNHEPETNSVEVHVSRLRGKLADCGCEGLVATDPAGGYRLADAPPFMLGGEEALDAHLREHRRRPAKAE
jgi:DNA-binding response OmpR family regulator